MPKLDLVHPTRIKTYYGEVSKLKGSGFYWNKPSSSAVISILSGTGYTGSVYSSTVAGQWYADDVAISGATGSTYTLDYANEGKAIRCGNSNVIQMWVPWSISGAYVMDIRSGLTLADGYVTGWATRGVVTKWLQETAARQPKKATYNGVEVLGLNGVEGNTTIRSLYNNSISGIVQQRTALMYAIPTVSGASNNFFCGLNQQYQFRREGSKVISVKLLNGTVSLQTGWTWENNVPGIIASRWDSNLTNPKISFNGESKTLAVQTAVSVYPGGSTMTAMGTDFTLNNQDFKGYQSSSFVCDSLLTDGEISKVEGWIAHTLGVQSQLIETHPYATQAPRVQ